MEQQNNTEFQLDDGFSGKLSGARPSAGGTSYHYHSTVAAVDDSNIGLGLLGALIGAIPGCILWVILGRIGFVAGIAGYAIMAGAMFCYKKLGGTIDKKGLILCIIITLAAILFSNVLEYAIEIHKYLIEEGMDIALFSVLVKTPSLIMEAGLAGSFALNLVIGYALTALSCRRSVSL